MDKALDIIREIERECCIDISIDEKQKACGGWWCFSKYRYWNLVVFGNGKGWRGKDDKKLGEVLEKWKERKVFADGILGPRSLYSFLEYVTVSDGEYFAKIMVGRIMTGLLKRLIDVGYCVENKNTVDSNTAHIYYLRMPIDGFEEILKLIG